MAPTFRGNDRFRLIRELGAGGMGIVYEARDLERDETVALKTLTWADAEAIHRFKREFRALADVAHANLVCLHELVADGDDWFFTMELVNGVDLVSWVRPGGRLDEQRLRESLRQLAQGLAAIHAAGKVHRDLKPSNVLVTADGRVVILDFGITADATSRADQLHTVEHGLMGTVGYMSPEQSDGQASPASDWYACGVILFEALTGQLPFSGTTWQILLTKSAVAAPSPDRLQPALPKDLVQLCNELLVRDPAARPAAADVLKRLGVAEARDPLAQRGVFVGRDEQLTGLHEALDLAVRGRAAWVSVHGPSGIGKSTLLAHFAEQAAAAGVLVMPGRCYEREALSYKALDGVVDHLVRVLRAMPPARLAEILPADMAAASRVFPALHRVEAVAALPGDAVGGDPVQVRRRAVAALRTLLANMAAAQPLAAIIDDVHWADQDSVFLLDALFHSAGAPPVLVVVAFRSEEIANRPFLRAWLEGPRGEERREVRVGPLPQADARRLASQLIGRDLDAAATVAVARESAGSPLFIEELARHVASGADATAARAGVADMLRARVAMLPAAGRAVLETLAVAGRPLDSRLVRQAVGVETELRPMLARLRAERLVRSSGGPDRSETYHDRVREVVAADLPPARTAEIHRALALALEAGAEDDPERLIAHWQGAGEAGRAARYAALAAARASQALAFGRAIEFYNIALRSEPVEDRFALRVGLADALASAGHGPEASREYLQAAQIAPPEQHHELRRRAAEQLLRAGHLDHGMLLMSEVLGEVGLSFAPSRARLLFRTLMRRGLVAVRGYRFRERTSEVIARRTDLLRRIDTCWALAVGLARIDHVSAADFQTQHLLLALRLGDPYRMARALAVEATFHAINGVRREARVARLLSRIAELAERTGHPHARGSGQLAAGISSFYCGHFAAARSQCLEAERTLRERCTGVTWEVVTAQTYLLSALCYLGEYGELARQVPALLRDAVGHGDFYAAADVGGGRSSLAWLILDDVAGARDAFRYAVGPGAVRGYPSQMSVNLLARCQIALYVGSPDEAWSHVLSTWPDLERSLLLRIQLSRIEALHLAGRCALALAVAQPSQREATLGRARRLARRIAREGVPMAAPLADLLEAGIAQVTGERARAAQLLGGAAEAAGRAGMEGYAAAARWQHARLLAEGHAAAGGEADGWMRQQGVLRPDRLAAMLVPGFD